MLVACGSTDELAPAPAQGATDASADASTPEASGGTGGSVLLEAGSEGQADPCDGLDNDGDGKLDDGCTCSAGATQKCYPGPGIPEGCKQGEQTCVGGGWGSAKCVGATLPAQGEQACCTVLGPSPEHPLLDAFLGAYPSSALPKDPDQINAFNPVADGHAMTWSQVNVGNELVDASNGGVIEDNLVQGRTLARQEAEKGLPAGFKVVDVKEPPVTIEILGGQGKCNGVGYAWGSALFQTPDDAVSEFVYLYIGLCANDKDAEGFYYSEQPVELCKAPEVVK